MMMLGLWMFLLPFLLPSFPPSSQKQERLHFPTTESSLLFIMSLIEILNILTYPPSPPSFPPSLPPFLPPSLFQVKATLSSSSTTLPPRTTTSLTLPPLPPSLLPSFLPGKASAAANERIARALFPNGDLPSIAVPILVGCRPDVWNRGNLEILVVYGELCSVNGTKEILVVYSELCSVNGTKVGREGGREGGREEGREGGRVV